MRGERVIIADRWSRVNWRGSRINWRGLTKIVSPAVRCRELSTFLGREFHGISLEIQVLL